MPFNWRVPAYALWDILVFSAPSVLASCGAGTYASRFLFLSCSFPQVDASRPLKSYWGSGADQRLCLPVSDPIPALAGRCGLSHEVNSMGAFILSAGTEGVHVFNFNIQWHHGGRYTCYTSEEQAEEGRAP